MKLYFFPVAPNPTRVRLYLEEKRSAGCEIPIEEISVDLSQGEQRRPEHLARNPFGSLPVLELDDGFHIFESETILEYLEECHPDPPLFGRDARERASTRQLERVAEVRVLGPLARLIHATKSPLGLPPNEELAAAAREVLPAGLKFLDDTLSDGRAFLAGDRVSVADCTLAAALQFARFRDLEIDPGLAGIAHWDRAFRERPSAKSVLVI
jgi:glutathione S-transferase